MPIALLWLLSASCGGLSDGTPEAGEKTLRVAVTGRPVTLDPHLQNDAVSFSLLSNIYESLTAFDADMKLEPALAVGWETRGDRTWRLHLAGNVRFHDGGLLTAADVAFSLTRAREHPSSRVGEYLVAVEAVRVVDELTLDIATAWPSAELLNKLAFVAIVPRDTGETIEDPVGTGPFRWRGEEGVEVRLVRFEGYRGGPAHLEGLELVVEPDADRRADLLVAGQVDVATRLAGPGAARVQHAEGFRLEARSGLAVSYLALRVDREPFRDPRVRMAVHLALDRERLAAGVRGGYAKPAFQMVSPYVFGYSPSVRPVERNLERARELLAEAGYPDGLEIVVDVQERASSVEPVIAQLAEAGIRLEVREHPWEELMDLQDRGEAANVFGGFLCPSGDASDLLYGEIHSPNPAMGFPEGQLRGYSNAELDTLIERSAATFDVKRRQRLLQEAMQVLAEELPMIPLYVPTYLYGVREDCGWKPRLDGFIRGLEVGPDRVPS